jgi:UDP-galactopyranose mutase
VGRELYEKFFRGYTRKQWGLDPSQLDAQVAMRIPVRTNRDDRYFTDTFQFMPKHGFTRMFENMLDHPRITVELNADYREVRKKARFRQLIFTGPIDEYFDHRFGKLPYRSLEFQHRTLDREWLQPVAVVNYPNDFEFTRVTEFKHLTGQQHSKTSVVYEYPRAEGDAYYPIPRPETAAIYHRYRDLANLERNVHFVGRLATYRYYNMDQVVGQALTLYGKIAKVARRTAAARYADTAT